MDDKGGEERKNGSIKMKSRVVGVLGPTMSSQKLILDELGDKESENWIMSKKEALERKFDSNKRKKNLSLFGNV